MSDFDIHDFLTHMQASGLRTIVITDEEDLPMTDAQIHEAAGYLETREGGFANAIALAYYRADSDNQRKLVEAFGDLFESAYAKWHTKD
jgi:hypothetical protein